MGVIRHIAAETGKTAALGLATGLMLAVGIGFLTVAAWIVLAANVGAGSAALVIGAVYVGIALVMAAFLLAGPKSPPPPPARPENPMQDVLVAFMQGLSAGKTAARRD